MSADDPKRRLTVHDVIGALGDLPEGEDSVSVIRKQRDAADRPSDTPRVGDTITTAEQPCRHCGSCDGPPSCPDCDHADRPSVTDNARDEAERRYPNIQPRALADAYHEVFVAGAEWAAGRAETTTEPPYPTACENCGKSYDACTKRIRTGKTACCGTCGYTATHNQNDWEAWKREARAETTTATTEDIADALEQWDRGIDWRLAEQENLTRAAYLRGAEQLMSLLATARTRPTETEWGVIGDDDGPWIADLPEATREEAEAYQANYGGTVVRREVGPWTEVGR